LFDAADGGAGGFQPSATGCRKFGGQAAAVCRGSGPGDQSAVLQAAQDPVQGLAAGDDAAGEFGVGQSGAPADQFQARILWRGEFGGRSTASIAARRAAAAFLRV